MSDFQLNLFQNRLLARMPIRSHGGSPFIRGHLDNGGRSRRGQDRRGSFDQGEPCSAPSSPRSPRLKNVGRVASLLWLYYGVELIGALVEREVRRRMGEAEVVSLGLYPEGRPSEAPTAALVFDRLEGHRRHRLLDEQGADLRRFHAELAEPAREVLELLGVNRAPYGLD